jgi:hypothetical protein
VEKRQGEEILTRTERKEREKRSSKIGRGKEKRYEKVKEIDRERETT